LRTCVDEQLFLIEELKEKLANLQDSSSPTPLLVDPKQKKMEEDLVEAKQRAAKLEDEVKV